MTATTSLVACGDRAKQLQKGAIDLPFRRFCNCPSALNCLSGAALLWFVTSAERSFSSLKKTMLQKLGSIVLLACLCCSAPMLMPVLPAAAQSRLEGADAEALRLNQRGLQQLYRLEIPAALQSFEQALSTARAANDRFTEGAALNNIGLFYRVMSNYPRALDYYQQALVVAREIGDREGEGRTLSNIGLVYAAQKEYLQALDYAHQALAIARESGDRSAETQFLIEVGDFYGGRGENSQALDSYQQALVIAREQGDRQAEETILSNIDFIDFLIFIEEINRPPEQNP